MIEVERRPDGVAVVVLDHPAKPVNTLSPAVVDEFNGKVAPLLDEDDIRGLVVVSAKPDTFIAGADLELEALKRKMGLIPAEAPPVTARVATSEEQYEEEMEKVEELKENQKDIVEDDEDFSAEQQEKERREKAHIEESKEQDIEDLKEAEKLTKKQQRERKNQMPD